MCACVRACVCMHVCMCACARVSMCVTMNVAVSVGAVYMYLNLAYVLLTYIIYISSTLGKPNFEPNIYIFS